MNFDFSDEQKMFRDQLGRYLRTASTTARVREAFDLARGVGREIHAGLAELGALGVAIPEAYGGLGLGQLELCVVAEQVGRALAPAPVASSIYLFADLLMAAGSEAQKTAILPGIADGSITGAVAFAETAGSVLGAADRCSFSNGALSGTKIAVLDGGQSDFAIVSAVDAQGGSQLALVKLDGVGVTRVATPSLDPSRPLTTLAFEAARAEPLGPAGAGRALLERTLNRAAVLLAFEQVAGAEAALDLSVDYAKQRKAFGQVIGAFQAIKHKLADVYVDTVLARSNAYHAAWALSADDPELELAAATARISATTAFDHAARETIQTHGGIGFTWEADPHLYYRRAQHLGRVIGGESEWAGRVGDLLARQLPEVSAERIARPWDRSGAELKDAA